MNLLIRNIMNRSLYIYMIFKYIKSDKLFNIYKFIKKTILNYNIINKLKIFNKNNYIQDSYFPY